MKMKLLALFTVLPLVACSGSGGGSESAKGGNPPPAAPEKAFDGKMQKFNVEFVSSMNGSLKGGPYLAYRFEINSNEINKGDLNIYDCQNSSCSSKYLIYKMSCNFPWLTCRVTDGSGNDLKKGGDYKADAADVGDIQSAGSCRQFTGGAYESCFYLTLVDPKLRTEGYYDQYFASEFVPNTGAKTDLSIFYLQHRQ